MKIVAFFNNKGGVGKTTLVYHIAHMMATEGHRTLMVDLDPQSNLTAMSLPEDRLEEVWPDEPDHPLSLIGSLNRVMRGRGDVQPPHIEELREGLGLIPGDLALSGYEDKLSDSWPGCVDGDEASFVKMVSLYNMILLGAERFRAARVLVDVGPNLGPINRAALLSCDAFVAPLAPDLYSVQGLRNMGPTLEQWTRQWADRLARRPTLDDTIRLPTGRIQPIGYVVMQAGIRMDRPFQAYDRWVRRLPVAYEKYILKGEARAGEELGLMRHYQSLMPLSQDARKPMFELKYADGATGSHLSAVQRCHEDFRQLSQNIGARLSLL